MRAEAPAWPPAPRLSSTRTERPSRRGIDGGREAGRAGADDRDVVGAGRVERLQQAEAARQLGLLGIAQELAVGAEDDRQLGRIEMEPLDQGLRAGIGPGIEGLVRMGVVAQEVAQPQHVAIVGVADHHESAGPHLEQGHAAQDQGPHDPLAELGLGDQQGPEPLRRDLQRLAGLLRLGIQQARAAGELRQLAHEAAGAIGDDQLVGSFVAGDVDRAGQDERQAAADVAEARQHLAFGKRAPLTEAADALDLRRLKDREHLVASIVQRTWRHGLDLGQGSAPQVYHQHVAVVVAGGSGQWRSARRPSTRSSTGILSSSSRPRQVLAASSK